MWENVWTVLTKGHFSARDYNKLFARKIMPKEILEKIYPNAYRLKLPSHTPTFVGHLFAITKCHWTRLDSQLQHRPPSLAPPAC